jgi:triphosphoribosyl-dephospho-CoA synthase
MSGGDAARRAWVMNAFRTACRYDVLALKPGNVSVQSAGHRMTARDFLVSAAVSAAPASATAAGVGASVCAAVEATLAAVGCNTNLGILLLAVPLMHAALSRREGQSLRASLREVLAGTTVADSVAVFAAIRRANPAGLGTAAREDVADAPTLPLLEIMALAKARDALSAQYANGFEAVFELGVPILRAGCGQGDTLSLATTACFMGFLSAFPDTHIARKLGDTAAVQIQRRGQAVESTWKACQNPARRRSLLSAFDNALKNEGVNPGTSADLTVASLLAWLLDAAPPRPHGPSAPSGAQANPK